MEAKTFEFDHTTVTFLEKGIVEFHFCRPKVEVELHELKEVIDLMNKELDGKKIHLLVRTVKGAKMTQEARDLASSDDLDHISHADAIVRADYSHEMAANFFIRVNQPERPVRLFPNTDKAMDWLRAERDSKAEEE